MKIFITLAYLGEFMHKNTLPVSIFRYHSAVASVNAKIKLQQNLFSFLLEGEKTVQYAGTQVKIKPHQFLLLSAGNCLMSEKMAREGGRYRSILFSFDNIILADFFTRHPQVEVTAAGKNREVPVLLFEKDAFLVNFTESLGCMLASGQPVSANMQRVKLEELLLYLSENHPGQIQKLQHVCREAAGDRLIRQAITANINNNITVEELAFLCNTSLSTFKRRFAKIYGTSPNTPPNNTSYQIERLATVFERFPIVSALLRIYLWHTNQTNMKKEYFLALANYNRWANNIAIEWLNQINEEQWQQAITSSFNSIKQTAMHIAGAERIWIDFWKNVPDPVFLAAEFKGTKNELIEIWKTSSAGLKDFMANYPEENYQQQVVFNWRGEEWRMEFWQTFTHFINHATYHRGQLVTLLRQAGFTKFSSTDLATYYRVVQK